MAAFAWAIARLVPVRRVSGRGRDVAEATSRDHDLEPLAEAQPRCGRNVRSRYEASTLAPRAKQAPRRTPVRWYPIHGYQHDPSPLRAPSLPMVRAFAATPYEAAASREAHARSTRPPALDSGSYINAGVDPRTSDRAEWREG